MASGAASNRSISATCLPLVGLYALLCACAVAQPKAGEGQDQPPAGQRPPGERPPEGEMPQWPPPGEGPMPAWVFIVNAAQTPMDLFWIGHERRHQQVLEPNQLSRLNTFAGHDFEVTDEKADQNPNAAAPGKVEIRILEDSPAAKQIAKLWVCERKEEEGKAVIACRQEQLEYKGGMWDQHVDHLKKQCNGLLEKHPEDAAYFCNHDYTQWLMAQCQYDTAPEEFGHIYASNQKSNHERVMMDTSHVRKFTKVGHTIGKIPADLFEGLQKHWSEDRLKLPRPENHPRFSPVVPGCNTDSWMMRMGETTPELRKKLVKTLQPMVAKWASLKTEDIEFTAMYGIRMYRHGSSFPLHRDIPHTHILSAIIEIGVLDLDHPDPNFNGNSSWPLQIYDHSGELHTHEYKPGQIIFYESYTCPHGRPTPFQGREIASLFVHYRPKGWGPKDWDKEVMMKSKKNEL